MVQPPRQHLPLRVVNSLLPPLPLLEQPSREPQHARAQREQRSALPHEVTKCATKTSVFFSKIKNWYFCLFFRANLTVLGVLVGFAGQ
jgi:hypothetical protein